MTKLSLASCPSFCELPADLVDGPLRAAATACIELQKSAAADLVRSAYTPDRSGGEPVSKEALDHILASNTDVRGIATERDITNAIPFNIRSVERTVKTVRSSPPASISMIWSRAGWPSSSNGARGPCCSRAASTGIRAAVTWAGTRTTAIPAGASMSAMPRSQRSPSSAIGALMTARSSPPSTPAGTLRLFEVDPARPLWHAVWSETDRFSFGYVVRPWSLRHAVAHRLGL